MKLRRDRRTTKTCRERVVVAGMHMRAVAIVRRMRTSAAGSRQGPSSWNSANAARSATALAARTIHSVRRAQVQDRGRHSFPTAIARSRPSFGNRDGQQGRAVALREVRLANCPQYSRCAGGDHAISAAYAVLRMSRGSGRSTPLTVTCSPLRLTTRAPIESRTVWPECELRCFADKHRSARQPYRFNEAAVLDTCVDTYARVGARDARRVSALARSTGSPP